MCYYQSGSTVILHGRYDRNFKLLKLSFVSSIDGLAILLNTARFLLARARAIGNIQDSSNNEKATRNMIVLQFSPIIIEEIAPIALYAPPRGEKF